MSKVTVNRRGPSGTAGRVTLAHLRAGETFRFPRSADGTVYQLLSVSARSIDEGVLDEVDSYMFANVSTGQVFATEDSRTVVPVDCSVTVRERTNAKPPRSNRSSRSRTSTVSASTNGRSTKVVRAKRRSRR
jgi:hypothetical protein